MSFNPEQAHKEILSRLDKLIEVIETLTIVTSLNAGIPSTKLARIVHTAQARVSDISKNIVQEKQVVHAQKPKK